MCWKESVLVGHNSLCSRNLFRIELITRELELPRQSWSRSSHSRIISKVWVGMGFPRLAKFLQVVWKGAKKVFECIFYWEMRTKPNVFWNYYCGYSQFLFLKIFMLKWLLNSVTIQFLQYLPEHEQKFVFFLFKIELMKFIIFICSGEITKFWIQIQIFPSYVF